MQIIILYFKKINGGHSNSYADEKWYWKYNQSYNIIVILTCYLFSYSSY